MDVTSDDKWRVQLNQIRLTDENLLTLLNEHLDLRLAQVDGLQSKVDRVLLYMMTHIQQGVDDVIKLVVVDLQVLTRLCCHILNLNYSNF